MSHSLRLPANGQLTVPKAIRDKLHWLPGDILEILEDEGAITLRALPKSENPRQTRTQAD